MKFSGHSRRIQFLWLTLAICLFLGSWIGSAFVHVWYRQKILHMGKRIHAMETEIITLSRKNSDLMARVARIHSPNVLQCYAMQNFQEPGPEKYMRVSREEMYGTRQRVAQRIENTGHVLDSQRLAEF
ncbi:MAG: hypothetical protein LBG86_00600 [Puniceicoccales bacterium]|jgi:hypothetical protein|nr:hypothetical protein [Puniceicoccales bacterium]